MRETEMTEMQFLSPYIDIENPPPGSARDQARRNKLFIEFLRWVRWATLVMGVLAVTIGILKDIPQLYLVALSTWMMSVMTLVCRQMAVRRGLEMSVYIFVGTIYVALTPPFLFVSGLLPMMVLGNFLAVILVGLFVSPRFVLRVTVISASVSFIWIGLDSWRPFTFTMVEAPVTVTLPLTVISTLLSGYLLHLMGNDLTRVLEASRNYASELERSQAELVTRSRELEATAADLVTRSTQMEETNRQLQRVVQQSQRRADLLNAIARVSRMVAQIRDRDKLLSQVTHLISRHFGFYHVGIFLVDTPRRYAVLRAANSEGGRHMLARRHKLGVGSEGIVGYVTETGKPRIALDVGADAVYFDNPDLPETRSEVALPLYVGDEVIGALDVQSTQAAAFDQEAVTLLMTLADQIAITLENARLFEESQAALAQAQEAGRRFLREEWDNFLSGQPVTKSSRKVPSSKGPVPRSDAR